MKKLIIFIVAAFVVSGCARYIPQKHHNLNVPEPYILVPAGMIEKNQLTVQWLGNANVLIEDGDTRILVDGFFTRPGWLKTFLGTNPDHGAIDFALKRAGIDPKLEKINAVIPLHSHHDHAMDSPTVASLTGATMYGGASSKRIADGHGDVKFEPVRKDSLPLDVGAFQVSFRKHPHGTIGFGLRTLMRRIGEGPITKTVNTPAPVWRYKSGEIYSLHIKHPKSSIIVHGSANFAPAMYANTEADVVFLCIGFMGNMSDKTMREYYREIVTVPKARIVIPFHWDDFFAPLDEPLKMRGNTIADKPKRALDFLREETKKDDCVSLIWLPEFVKMVASFPQPRSETCS